MWLSALLLLGSTGGVIHCPVTADIPRTFEITSLGDILVSQGLASEAYTASGVYEYFRPVGAFDGEEIEANDYWNGGDYAPQWIEVDLGKTQALTRIRMVVAMLPDGDTTHDVWVSNEPIQEDLSRAVKLHTFDGPTVDRQVFEQRLEAPRAARYVQVRTTQSPSWVAWMEVQVFAAPLP